LLRGSDPAPHLEAEVCFEYGRFRSVLGDSAEAEAYWTRAGELWRDLGAAPRVGIVEDLLDGIRARDATAGGPARPASASARPPRVPRGISGGRCR
jgi:hypothetical protein